MTDITVRGAGIFGLCIAWTCVQRGARVQVIDPNGAGAGASGGIVGALAPHTPDNWNDKKQFQLESLLMAKAFWADIEQIAGVKSGYGRTGRLQPVPDDRQLVLARQRCDSASDLWHGQATWHVHPVGDLGAWTPPSPTGFVVHDTLSGRLHPHQACTALVAALRTKGVHILPEGPDVGQVVWATGVTDLMALNTAFGKPIGTGVKGQAALLGYDARDAPQLFANGIHMIPHADGTLAIGSTNEREYDAVTTTDAQLDDVIDRARAAMPILTDAPILARWAGLRPRTRSRAPMLGDHPLHPGQFIANGGFKIGFGMAPKIGQVMADLVLDQRNGIPHGFRPESSVRAEPS